MGWKITAVTEVPLGKRILRIGSKGNDVRELQQLLAKSGFYFGSVDGVYGILTEEAVLLFQKTFNLRNDGIAGSQLITALKTTSSKLNRIVYTVKTNENLKAISQKHRVSKSAWQVIPGQGNPQRNIYPGMKLLLNQKAVLCSGKKPEGFPATASLEIGWKLTDDGELVRLKNEYNAGSFQTVATQPETWEKVLRSYKYWKILSANLKRECGRHWGIDFRNAPLETIFRWIDLLRYLCQTIPTKEIPFIIIPMLNDGKGLQNRIYWLNLPQISNFVKLLLFEPLVDLNSPLAFLESNMHIGRMLHQLIRYNLGSKAMLMGWVGGWEWNIDQGYQCRPVTFREGRLLAAMNHRSVKYNPETTNTIVDYIRRRQRHCLIFRDRQGWLDWVKIGLKANLLGFVFHNSKDLGKFGRELICDSFGVLSEDQL